MLEAKNAPVILLEKDGLMTKTKFSSEYFINNYKQFLLRHVADGSVRQDTLLTYVSHIDQFINWCNLFELNPLAANENHIVDFRNELISLGLARTTIALKLSCIRRFFAIAESRGVIASNPVAEVKAPKERAAENIVGAEYITAGKLEYLFSLIEENTKSPEAKIHEEAFRAKAIVALMGLQGLRTVEVHRMSEEHINWEKGLVLIKGKGRDRFIAPREDVLYILQQYVALRVLKENSKDEFGTPIFVSISNNHTGCRLSRCGIRDLVNFWFEKSGIRNKEENKGKSCHLLRHTTGSLLYQSTHDLIVVQKELGHADPKTTSKYAHVQNMLTERYAKAIPVRI